jgi:LuxR family transcriptional regulator, quorum-sensing system regulator BjaR1
MPFSSEMLSWHNLWGKGAMTRSQIQKTAFDIVETIDSAGSIDQIMDALSKAAYSFGYENFSIAGLPMPSESIDPYIMACGWPDQWASRYREENYVHIDPVIRQVRTASKPFMWSDAPIKPQDVLARKMMNEATEFGLVEGFAVPIYTTHGFQAIVTFGANELVLNKSEQAALHLVAIYAHQAIRAFLPDKGIQNDKFKPQKQLSLREIECLKWVASGKTAYEISIITGISQRTVQQHMRNLMQKLNATNGTQAVAQALRSRIIV